MEIMRLVVTGPVGAGKSTFIRSISEIEVVDTDRNATDETAQLKKKTTVAMDFGRLKFGEEMALHLYGTPGQSRFDFMWDVLIRKAHAYILLVPANRPEEFRNARVISNFMRQRTKAPMVIGFTHLDCPEAWTIENMAIALGYGSPLSRRPPMIAVNPTDAGSVATSIVSVVEQFSQMEQFALR
jgi:uncharacterized protein